MRRAASFLAFAALLAGPARPQEPAGPEKGPTAQAADLVNALLGALMGGGEVTGPRLQREVEEAGGLPFREDVPVAFLGPEELATYLRDLFDSEYPVEQARVDERLLRAFDLLSPDVDLRSVRARVLEDNVAGFYDERPDRRRLYAVSVDRSLTPMNQVVLAHELRHAQQDQYADLHTALDDTLSDFDDRRVAFVSLLEGDATLVMERFIRLRLGALGGAGLDAGGTGDASALAAAGLLEIPGAPPVVRDHLVQPYLAGLSLARAIWERGGATAMKEAWSRPPLSTEQVLHPEKYFAGETPRTPAVPVAAPRGARPVSEGVLGELLLRSLLEAGGEEAAAGWGGDAWRLWELGPASALAWRSVWDSPSEAVEFEARLRERFGRRRGRAEPRGRWTTFAGDGGWRYAIRRHGDTVDLVSCDDEAVFARLLGG